jgi:hypothetical protein
MQFSLGKKFMRAGIKACGNKKQDKRENRGYSYINNGKNIDTQK